MKASAIFEGRIYHSRRVPRKHEFQTRACFLYLDLDELPDVFHGRWLWSTERWNVAFFRRADYLGHEKSPLKEAVLDCVERKLDFRPSGSVRLLTQIRTWGYVFNPVSFYYCFGLDGRLACIVAEITNTPWGEKHRYVLDARGSSQDMQTFRFDKDFHVSPFFGMEQVYEWRFRNPGDRLEIHMQNLESNEVVFGAGMVVQRKEITGWRLTVSLLAFPLQTFRVSIGIYWHAARLWLKRIPFHTHPDKQAASPTPRS